MKRLTLYLALLLVGLRPVLADSVNVHGFAPAANPAYTFTEDALLNSAWNQSGGVRAKGKAFFSAYYDLVNDPFVELSPDQKSRRATLIESMNTLSLTMGYGLVSNVQAGASISMSMVRFPDGHEQLGLSDSRLFTKIRLNSDTASVVFAVMPELMLPSGNRSMFLSNDSVSGGLRLIAEHDFGVLQVAGNVGYRYAPDASYRDLDMRSTVPLSLGMLMPVSRRWALNADATGQIPLPPNGEQSPSSLYLGARYRLPQDLMFTLGGAVGAVNGYSSADFRIVAGITLMPSAKTVVAQKPLPAPIIKPAALSAVVKPRVEFTSKEVIIREEVKFKHAKADLTDSGMNLLDEVAAVLKENKKNYKLIVIEGHTNELGTYPYNQKLSEDRAATVKDYLASRGIDAKGLMTVGYGKTKMKPLTGLSKEAWLQTNRRVAFKVMQ